MDGTVGREAVFPAKHAQRSSPESDSQCLAAADGVLRLNDTSSVGINRERAAMSELPWYVYLLQFVGGLLLANGVPYRVQGISGHRFQIPFALPAGVGESSPVVNIFWGFRILPYRAEARRRWRAFSKRPRRWRAWSS